VRLAKQTPRERPHKEGRRGFGVQTTFAFNVRMGRRRSPPSLLGYPNTRARLLQAKNRKSAPKQPAFESNFAIPAKFPARP
jgi:hypothetical protein